MIVVAYRDIDSGCCLHSVKEYSSHDRCCLFMSMPIHVVSICKQSLLAFAGPFTTSETVVVYVGDMLRVVVQLVRPIWVLNPHALGSLARLRSCDFLPFPLLYSLLASKPNSNLDALALDTRQAKTLSPPPQTCSFVNFESRRLTPNTFLSNTTRKWGPCAIKSTTQFSRDALMGCIPRKGSISYWSLKCLALLVPPTCHGKKVHYHSVTLPRRPHPQQTVVVALASSSLCGARSGRHPSALERPCSRDDTMEDPLQRVLP